jgi:N-acetylglucosaminyldiphosphoundecaprenol N-acetyl-beta-D-mannosaminyltransferase
MKKVKILNVQFDACTKDEALGRVIEVLKSRDTSHKKHIATPNPEMVLAAQINPEFMRVLNSAYLSIPDGIGILWAATLQEQTRRDTSFSRLLKGISSLAILMFRPKVFKRVFRERVTGVDFMESICAISRGASATIFLLGAEPGVAEKTKQNLEAKYPGIKITGVLAGSPSEKHESEIIEKISKAAPQILFVAYGSPAQELWIARNLQKLKSVKIAMGVGGAFDFISGHRRRAPAWMRNIGLEWLYRLIKQPSRIRRIWNATIKFPTKIIKGK